jgi:arginyl-tRNA synthetase
MTQYAEKIVREEVASILKNAGLNPVEIKAGLGTPPSPELGDYSFNCFLLSKKSPKAAAEDLVKRLNPQKYVKKIQTAGPYINFTADKEKFTALVLQEIFTLESSYGNRELGAGKTVVVDFSSPNIAKPFGIGHLRSTVIGNSICKLYESLGYTCIGINHLGDWGTQFGKLIVAYRKWGKEKQLKVKPVQQLYDLYVKFHAEAQKDKSLEEEARDWFRRLEDGEQEATRLWCWFRDISLKEFQRIYDILNIHFDSYAGESFYNLMLPETITKLKTAGLAQESQGALIVDLERFGMSPCLLRKTDGSTLYATRDIAAVMYRFDTYGFDKMIYVVGADQKLYFRQIFKVLELLGHPWADPDADALVHVPFGLVRFGTGKMSTRKGNVIFLEEVFQKAVDLTEKIIEEKNPDLEDKHEIATQVGIGAIVFNDLSNKRMKDVDFSWDRMLNFNGQTGPYVQYTYARFSSVLRKYGCQVDDNVNLSLLNSDMETEIVRLLSRFPETVKHAADEYEPSVVTTYLLDLCEASNRFYNHFRVLSEDLETSKARVLLVWCIRTVLGKGLSLLGMETPERM